MTLAVPELLEDADLWAALGAGGVSAALVAAFGQDRRRRRTRLPLAGLAVALPAVTVIALRLQLPEGLLAGLLVLAVAGLLVDLDGVPGPIGLVVAAPGAWLVGWHGGLVPVTWIRAAVFAVTLLGGAALASFDDRFARRGYAPAFLALATVGVYYTVPDPYHAVLLMGSALPASLLGWPRALVRFGWSGALASAGLLAWVVARDGFGRQSSIVGGLACLGLLALEPCWRGFRGRAWSPLDALPRGSWRWPLALGAQLVCVYGASRVAGVRDAAAYDPSGPLWRGRVAGALMVVVAGAVVASLLAAVVRRTDRGRQPSR